VALALGTAAVVLVALLCELCRPRATRIARSRSQRARRCRSRRTTSGSIWRPGRCMLAPLISPRSSAVSAIHLASTSSESGSNELPYGLEWSGNATQYSLSSAPVRGTKATIGRCG